MEATLQYPQEQHYHYDCPLCREQAIPERCPGYRIEWSHKYHEYVRTNMIRISFKDGTYMDVQRSELHWYECDPDFDRWQELYNTEEEEGGEYLEENGKRID